MSDYTISYTKGVTGKDADYLKNMLDIVDENDNITILIDQSAIDKSDLILKLLYENDFSCRTSQLQDGQGWRINAVKDGMRDIIEIQ